jgi:hypothetical protein
MDQIKKIWPQKTREIFKNKKFNWKKRKNKMELTW